MPKCGKYSAFVECGEFKAVLPIRVQSIESLAEALRLEFEKNPPGRLALLMRYKFAGDTQARYVSTEKVLERMGIECKERA
jgi:hypothetical protein